MSTRRHWDSTEDRTVSDVDAGDPFWGIVDNYGNVITSSGRVQIFKTRKEARQRNNQVTGTVRKLYVQYEKRDAGGA